MSLRRTAGAMLALTLTALSLSIVAAPPASAINCPNETGAYAHHLGITRAIGEFDIWFNMITSSSTGPCWMIKIKDKQADGNCFEANFDWGLTDQTNTHYDARVFITCDSNSLKVWKKTNPENEQFADLIDDFNYMSSCERIGSMSGNRSNCVEKIDETDRNDLAVLNPPSIWTDFWRWNSAGDDVVRSDPTDVDCEPQGEQDC